MDNDYLMKINNLRNSCTTLSYKYRLIYKLVLLAKKCSLVVN